MLFSEKKDNPHRICNSINNILHSKIEFLADDISDNLDNPYRLWNSIINNILHRIPPYALPEFTSVKSLYDHFSKYFVDKIETIHSKFLDKVLNIPSVQKT